MDNWCIISFYFFYFYRLLLLWFTLLCILYKFYFFNIFHFYPYFPMMRKSKQRDSHIHKLVLLLYARFLLNLSLLCKPWETRFTSFPRSQTVAICDKKCSHLTGCLYVNDDKHALRVSHVRRQSPYASINALAWLVVFAEIKIRKKLLTVSSLYIYIDLENHPKGYNNSILFILKYFLRNMVYDNTY